MDTQNHSVDILHGALLPGILIFAMPIALSSMLQQLFNAADTAVAGRFADGRVLAAVGTNGEIVAFLVTISAGLAVGANVLLARFLGERKNDRISEVLHTSILLALLLGILGGVIGQFAARPLLRVINTPENILKMAESYLHIYFCGYPFLLIYDFGVAILRSKGDSKRPFFALAAAGMLNVMLNLIFTAVFRWGIVGLAAATDAASLFSACCVLYWLRKEPSEYRFSLKRLALHAESAKTILRIGLPAAMQSAVFCMANIFIQAVVNGFGENAIAGSTIAMNFEYFAYYIITAFGQTATTFISQNFAARNRRRCVRILKICLVCSVLLCAAITVPVTVWRQE